MVYLKFSGLFKGTPRETHTSEVSRKKAGQASHLSTKSLQIYFVSNNYLANIGIISVMLQPLLF